MADSGALPSDTAAERKNGDRRTDVSATDGLGCAGGFTAGGFAVCSVERAFGLRFDERPFGGVSPVDALSLCSYVVECRGMSVSQSLAG